MFTRCGIVACQQFSNAGAAGRVRKFQVVVNWAEVAVYFAMSGLPTERHQSEGSACPLGAQQETHPLQQALALPA
jgi:hypothetical protein